MTCIAGLAHNGKVYIGGDSAAVAGLDLRARADRKVFRNGPFVMGFTSSFRMGQLLAYQLDPPKRHPDADIMRFMVCDFVNAVRLCLRNGGFSTVNNSVESGGHFLVGYEGRLFHVEGDFQVGETACGFDATGCGESFALGALRNSPETDPEAKILAALATAAEFSAGVRAPFFVESV